MHKGKTKYMTNLSIEDSIQIEDQEIPIPREKLLKDKIRMVLLWKT